MCSIFTVASQVICGKRVVQGPRHPERMGGSVEEVRIAERDVLRAHLDLLCDVGDDHVDRHDAEPPFVDGHHRTVPAQVLAPARGLGESERARRAVGHHEPGVAIQGGQGVAQGRAKTRSSRCR